MGVEDKRHFKRYDYHSACEIRVANDIYDGYVVDYSDGLGVIAEKAYLLKKGVEADIRIPDSATEMRGQVAWVMQRGKDFRVGFKRIGNLKGNMRDYKIADVLIGIQRGTKTGTLEIKSKSVIKRVYIKNGDMVFADSSLENDRLGEMLVREGKITLDQFNLASDRLRKSGEKLGKILVRMSCLTPRELYQAVRHQVHEIILSLFNITEGEFEFKEGTLPGNDLITLVISAANIIYRGMKRIQNFTDINQMCPPMEAVLVLSHDPMDIFQSISLEPEDKLIFYLLDRGYTLQKVLSLSPSSSFETLKTISAFLKIGIIKIEKPDEAPSKISVGDVMEEQSDENTDEYLLKVEELYARCASAEYYSFFGIDREASVDEVQKAFFRISKQFHPDRHFMFPKHDIKDKLIKIITHATEGYIVLADPEKREKHNNELLSKVQNISITEETAHELSKDVNNAKEYALDQIGGNNSDVIISDLQEMSEQPPQEDPETHFELGVAYMEMGLEEDAIQEFRIASNDPSKTIKCFKAITMYYIDKKDYQQAIEEYKKLLSALPDENEHCLEIKYELATIYEKNNDYENALAYYSEIHSKDIGYRDVSRKIENVFRSMLERHDKPHMRRTR